MTAHTLPTTICGLRTALQKGLYSGAEVLAAQAAHFEKYGSRYRCVVRSAGHAHEYHPGLLGGVGLAHKDIFNTDAGLPACGRPQDASGQMTAGSAIAIRRLARAGAANLGALAMAEFACGATGEAVEERQPVNPLDPDLAVGGSSSGSAVAVAAGLCYASLGTDTAGSVRIPAATCGIVGLKTTYRAIPLDGTYPLAPSLDNVGILARSAADAGVVLAAVGNHAALRYAATRPGGMEKHLLDRSTPRIGLAIPFDSLQEDVALALNHFVHGFAQQGNTLDALVPNIKQMTACAEVLLHVEAAQVHWARLRDGHCDLLPSTRAVIEPGTAIPALWYRAALAQRARFVKDVIEASFSAADIVLLPALSHPLPDWNQVHSASPSFDARQLIALHRWMPFVNYLGFPSIVFPVGRDFRDRPVSIQVLARPNDEETLLAFAYRVEREVFGEHGFHMPRIATEISSINITQ